MVSGWFMSCGSVLAATLLEFCEQVVKSIPAGQSGVAGGKLETDFARPAEGRDLTAPGSGMVINVDLDDGEWQLARFLGRGQDRLGHAARSTPFRRIKVKDWLPGDRNVRVGRRRFGSRRVGRGWCLDWDGSGDWSCIQIPRGIAGWFENGRVGCCGCFWGGRGVVWPLVVCGPGVVTGRSEQEQAGE